MTIEDNAGYDGCCHQHHAEIGAGTMIDMGGYPGGRATVGKNSHIGRCRSAGAIISASLFGSDNALVGANAVVIAVWRGNGSVRCRWSYRYSRCSFVAGVPAASSRKSG